jgi:hypothetical protein
MTLCHKIIVYASFWESQQVNLMTWLGEGVIRVLGAVFDYTARQTRREKLMVPWLQRMQVGR